MIGKLEAWFSGQWFFAVGLLVLMLGWDMTIKVWEVATVLCIGGLAGIWAWAGRRTYFGKD